MSEAMKLIVDGDLSLKDRAALEGLRAHRQRLRKQLEGQPKSWVDATKSIELFDEELSIIAAAIDRL